MVRPIHYIVGFGHRLQGKYTLWLVALLSLVLVALLLVGRDALNIWRYAKYVSTSCQASTVLVMGAAQYDGRPSPAFKRRLDKAFDLYQQGCAETIVVTGGKREGDRFSEGEAGVRYLSSLGIPEPALQSETRSTSSYENLLLSKPLLKEDMLTIVTDDLHAYRTRFLAIRLGYGVEMETVVNPYQRLHYAARELVMLMAYHLGIVR